MKRNKTKSPKLNIMSLYKLKKIYLYIPKFYLYKNKSYIEFLCQCKGPVHNTCCGASFILTPIVRWS